MPQTSSKCSDISLPSSQIGRLIGKGGETIQELEKRTDCKIKIPRRGDRSASDEIVCVSICYVGSRPRQEAETHETRCVRAAQLICVDCLSVADSLTQTDEEREAQEKLEAARVQVEQEKIAVQRVLISWPDFDEVDVRAALKECCDDEDAAIDLLLDGFKAEPESLLNSGSLTSVESYQIGNHEEVKEDFPPLHIPVTHQEFEPKSFTLGRSSRNAWLRKPEAQASYEDFPSLPVSKPCVRANGAMASVATPMRKNLSAPQRRRMRN